MYIHQKAHLRSIRFQEEDTVLNIDIALPIINFKINIKLFRRRWLRPSVNRVTITVKTNCTIELN